MKRPCCVILCETLSQLVYVCKLAMVIDPYLPSGDFSLEFKFARSYRSARTTSDTHFSFCGERKVCHTAETYQL